MIAKAAVTTEVAAVMTEVAAVTTEAFAALMRVNVGRCCS